MVTNETGDDARARALQALVAIEGDGAGVQAALRRALDTTPALDGVERGLATELVYGVERKRRPLDAWIAPACSRGLYQLDLTVLTVLRLGAYQLAYLPRIPAFAAVHATVELAKRALPSRTTGFVHAVLRTLGRQLQAGQGPGGPELPAWIERRIADLADDLHQEPGALLEAFCQAAPLHLHAVGGAKTAEAVAADLQAQGVTITPIEPAVPGVWRSEGGAVFRSQVFAERRVLAQDGGSAAVVEWLDAQPGEKVADIAAGRGAKSVCLAARGAQVLAVDLDAGKLAEAEALARQAGQALLGTQQTDASIEIPLPAGSFDAVLLDAPCTGLGTLRRRPEIRHRRQAADVVRMAWLERKILDNAALLVRPGGRLVVATCSFTREEGPLLIEDFLNAHPQFVREPGEADWVRPLLDDHGDLRTHPLAGGMDAFYAARLRRRPD